MTVVLSRWNCSVSRSMPNFGQRGTVKQANEEEGQFQAGRQGGERGARRTTRSVGIQLVNKVAVHSQSAKRSATRKSQHLLPPSEMATHMR